MEQQQIQQQQIQQQQYEEIDIMEIVRKLLKNWKFIAKWGAIAAVIGIVVAFSIPKVYTVEAKLAPELVSRTNSNLSSLASLAGMNLSSTNTADAVYPDLYPYVVNSTPFITELFAEPVEFKSKKEKVSTDYYTYIKEYCRAPWWSAVFNAPFKVLGWFMGLFREKEEVIEGFAEINPTALTKEQSDIALAISENISLAVDKKTSVISISVNAQDPKVAKHIADVIIDKIQKYVYNYRTEKSRKDLAYYQQLCDEAKENYYAVQQKYAEYVDANQAVVLQRVRIESDRLRNESELAYNLYNTCSQQLQAAKAKVQQETPVCAVINPPVLPLTPSKPSKLKLLVVFIFLGAAFASAWLLFIKEWLEKFKQTNS